MIFIHTISLLIFIYKCSPNRHLPLSTKHLITVRTTEEREGDVKQAEVTFW